MIQAMLTGDTSTDIYIMMSDNPAYTSLLRRGYMASLNDSEELSAFAESVYPSIAKACRVNEDLYAVPLNGIASMYMAST